MSGARRAFVLAAAAVTAAVWVSAAAGAGGPVRITADPNPVPSRDGVGGTEIRWSGPTARTAVYVERNGGSPELFASGRQGTQRAPWIEAGSVFRFTVRTGGPASAALAAVHVRTASAAHASPVIPRTAPAGGPLNATLALQPRLRIALAVALLAAVLGGLVLRRRGRPGPARIVVSGGAVALAALVVAFVLSDPAIPLAAQPFPDTSEYADSARNLSEGDGYVTRVHYGVEQPPRYPPGFAVALAPFAAAEGFPDGVEHGVRALAALSVLLVFWAAWTLGGPVAAAVTGALLAVSPFTGDSASLVLADEFSAALAVAAVALVATPTPRRIAGAGVLAGALVTVRLALAVIPLALLIALPSRFRRRFALCAAPLVLALVAYQWITFGNPFTTGYDYYVSGRSFSPGYAVADNPRGDGPWVFPDVLNGRLLQSACPCPLGGPQAGLPNVWFYPAVLLGLFWVLAPPLATVPGLVWAIRRRATVLGRAAILVVLGSLVVLVPYFYQATRFAAPATLLLVVLTGVAIARAVGEPTAEARAP